MTAEEKFDIVLAKNRLARELKTMYYLYPRTKAPEHIKELFDQIEKVTGVSNQPTGRDILESDMDI